MRCAVIFTGLSTCIVVWNALCLMFTGLSTCMVVWNALCFVCKRLVASSKTSHLSVVSRSETSPTLNKIKHETHSLSFSALPVFNVTQM